LESSRDEIKNFPNGIQVQPVTHKKDFKLFYNVPFQVYRDNPFWVAPFWYEMKDFLKKKNPFWSHADSQLFIAKKNDKPVGRIAAIIDHTYCKSVGEKIGFFGFFECTDDYECAQALLQTAQDWLVEREMKVMRGPIDGRVDVGCGFLYSGFELRPKLLSTYSPAYYVSYAERFGLKKSRDLFLYTIDLTKPLPKVLEEKARQCTASGIQIRPFHRLRTQKELKWWVELFLETFSDHWGFVPVSSEEVRTRFGIKQLRWFVDSRLFLVAESRGSPVAYLWATPDYNQIFQKMHGRLTPFEMLRFLCTKRKINSGKLHFIGIKKEFRDQNIGSYLNYAILVEMKNRGYVSAEVGWIDEQNAIAHSTIAITGATVYKKYRVFEKDLAG
jgi:ribosomal protein S18 acetylase RimI-like enzyme